MVILTVLIEEVPHFRRRAVEVTAAGRRFYRVVLHYGFMDEIDVPGDLARTPIGGRPFNMMTTSFFLGRQKLIASKDGPAWRCGASSCSPG